MPILIIKALLSTYFKHLLWTIAGVIGAIFFSFYLLGWWGILTSIILVPIIIVGSLGYIINEIKKNPMMMLQSMVMGTPGMSAFLNEKNIESMGNMMRKSKDQSTSSLTEVEDVSFKEVVVEKEAVVSPSNEIPKTSTSSSTK